MRRSVPGTLPIIKQVKKLWFYPNSCSFISAFRRSVYLSVCKHQQTLFLASFQCPCTWLWTFIFHLSGKKTCSSILSSWSSWRKCINQKPEWKIFGQMLILLIMLKIYYLWLNFRFLLKEWSQTLTALVLSKLKSFEDDSKSPNTVNYFGWNVTDVRSNYNYRYLHWKNRKQQR